MQGMTINTEARRAIGRFVKKYTLAWYAVTTALYLAAIPITVFVFPATTLLLTVFVLVGGFTSSMAAFASAIVAQEQDDVLKDEKNQQHKK